MPPSKEISQNETANLISKKAMVVVAHADDAEYGCSGTIAKLCSQKWDVTYVLCTNGSKGSSDKNMTSEEIAAIRRKEQIEAGHVLGLKDVAFLDAPVSGGEPGAIAGSLAIMVGGKKEVFDAQYALLSTMGGSIVLCGDYGAGNTTKLANQIIVAANIEAVAEALVLAKKAGLDPSVVFNAIKGGLAGSTVLNAKAPMMIEGNFQPGFRIVLHQKDLHNALLTGKDLGVPLPVTSLVQQMLGALINDGKGDADHSAIANFIEGMAGTTISSG